MPVVDFAFSTAGLDRLVLRIGQAEAGLLGRARAATVAAASDVVRIARVLAPEHTGRLRESIGFDLYAGGLVAVVGPPRVLENSDGRMVAYPGFMERGTAAHRIEPRTAGALWWEAPPRKGWAPDHPLPGVNHPGTAPRPYMEPAGQRVWPVYAAAIERAGVAAWRSI